KIEEFTGDTVVRTTWEALYRGMDLVVKHRVNWINSEFTIELDIYSKTPVYTINKGDEFMLKLYNGDIIKLESLETKISSPQISQYGSGSIVKIAYLLTQNSIDLLKKDDIDKIRINTNKGYLEGELTKKQSQKLIKAIEILE
ncbi:MAG: hypothetical protein PHE56_16690, partial [Bacteroidales bacterium]|nr:hypothetical protein [Bacteroidales bacterium]